MSGAREHVDGHVDLMVRIPVAKAIILAPRSFCAWGMTKDPKRVAGSIRTHGWANGFDGSRVDC